jgi:hypothetical protein
VKSPVIAELDTRIAALTEMRSTLVTLAQACHGDLLPDCSCCKASPQRTLKLAT